MHMSQQTLKVMQSRDLKRTTSKQNIGHTLGTVGIYAFLLIMALVVLFPFYWMVISSLKSTVAEQLQGCLHDR